MSLPWSAAMDGAAIWCPARRVGDGPVRLHFTSTDIDDACPVLSEAPGHVCTAHARTWWSDVSALPSGASGDGPHPVDGVGDIVDGVACHPVDD
jgi:hypothetical protein